MAKVTIDAQERIGKAKLQAQPTQVVPKSARRRRPGRCRARAVPTAGRGPAAGAGAGPGAVSAPGRGRPSAAARDPGARPAAAHRLGFVRRTR